MSALPTEKTFAEFFAGIGLMRLALEREGWSAAFANDIAPDKQAMYAAHFGERGPHFAVTDIHELRADATPSVTLATASFPCTDLSLAGARQGLCGKRSSAYWGFVRILEELGDRRPPLVLLENVAGFLSSRGGRDLEDALLALNRLGYAVDLVSIDASRFVPQSRVRLFVIGSTGNGREGRGPAQQSPRRRESDARPKALADFVRAHPNIAWQIRPLPPLPVRTASLRDVLEDLPEESPFWWNDERRDYLISQMSPRHAEALAGMTSADAWSFGTVFRRVRNGKSMAELRTDGVAGCLRTPRGGSGRQILVRAGYGQVWVRLLTPRECARLMGADDFVINVPLNRALFAFGDAVCVPVVSWLARSYLNPLVAEMQSCSAAHERSRVRGPGTAGQRR